ncbi:MAG: HAD hydrolase-like protein [Alphaproteobacteria bacterium]|nr:HAD hydrolase-like protein [Alphaproteobacteria bacterium]
MVYKYVVFDWDGTLADTYPVLSAAYDYAFTKLNMPSISYDEVKRITSTLQNRDTLGCMFGEKKEEAAKYFYEYIEKHHTEKLLPFDGAKDVLEYCKNSGKLIYLITNKSKQYIHDEIKILGFEKYFEKVVAAKEYEYDKPHPVACQAIFDYKLPPAEEIIVIGDGDADVKTAEALGGADSIICDAKDKYVGSKPTYKIKNIAEAIKILEK